jgi:hypothetical protein
MKKEIFILLIVMICLKTYGQQRDTLFALQDDKISSFFIIDKEYVIQDLDTLRVIRETLPKYPGGTIGLYRFLELNYNVPKSAIKKSKNKQIVAEFNIDMYGKVNDIHITKSVSKEADELLVEVLKKMRTWEPATRGGEPVECHYNLPININ